ncbi:MAG: alpha/beta fold hydrolase, partial [Betaproteobacteria bacterium]|nr:alpha/beta fold hydrolase [Betaproteobacteria bacterium]
GKPQVEPYTFENVARALESAIDGMTADPVVVVGHSMGGMIAQEAYALFPQKIRALALTFTSSAFGGTSSDFAQQFIDARIKPLDLGRTMAEISSGLMKTMHGTLSDPSGLMLAAKVMSSVPPDTYRKAVAMLTTFDRRALLPQISVPTLVLSGSDDMVAPAKMMERIAQKIPGSEYVCLPGCGHLGPMDQPDAFNAALLSFLQRHSL